MENNMGMCKFCGQTRILDVDEMVEDISEAPEEWNIKDYFATRRCDCDKSRSFRQKEQTKIMAWNNIEALFKEKHPDVQHIMQEAVQLLVDGKIYGVTFAIDSITRAAVTRKANGAITVKRILKQKDELEAEA